MAHRLSLRARTDLDDIWEYTCRATGDVAVADRQIDAITDRFRFIADWPRLGRARDDLRPGLRSHRSGNYSIFYRVDGPDIIILRILHGRRDIARLMGR